MFWSGQHLTQRCVPWGQSVVPSPESAACTVDSGCCNKLDANTKGCRHSCGHCFVRAGRLPPRTASTGFLSLQNTQGVVPLCDPYVAPVLCLRGVSR